MRRAIDPDRGNSLTRQGFQTGRSALSPASVGKAPRCGVSRRSMAIIAILTATGARADPPPIVVQGVIGH
jgi:hypothetical protein